MANEYNRLDSQSSVVGAFRKPEAEDIVLTGTLTVDQHNINFTTAPEYRCDLRADAINKNFFTNQPPERLTALHGFAEVGICTLCQLTETNRPGLVHGELRQSVTAVSYNVGICVLGMHLDGLQEKCLTSARYTFTGLSDWVPKATHEKWEKDQIVITIPLQERDILSFSLRQNRVEISLRAFPQLTSSETDNGRLTKSVAYVDVQIPDVESLSWFLDSGNRLENLFSLLTGASLALETIFIYRGEESGTVIAKRDSNPKPFDPRECVTCTPRQLANAMAIWLSKSKEFRSVENVALGVVRKGKLFIETQFLSLAQALEGIHRVTTPRASVDRAPLRKIRKQIVALMRQENLDVDLAERICVSISHANDPTFATRLTELCSRFSSALLLRMQIDPAQFVPDVVATRNIYTHTGSRRRDKRPLPIQDLFLTNQKIRSMLRGVLLLHLGIPEPQFAELLVREITRWK